MEDFDFLNEINSAGEQVEDGERRFFGDFGKLKQAWINEHLSPEIQQHQQEFVNQIRKKLVSQQIKIEEEQDSILKANLMQLELDKMNYVLKLYTKSRIQKVRKKNQTKETLFHLKKKNRSRIM